MDFWEKMGLCLNCYWLECYHANDKDPKNYECVCYRGMPLEWFRRQKKCINHTEDRD